MARKSDSGCRSQMKMDLLSRRQTGGYMSIEKVLVTYVSLPFSAVDGRTASMHGKNGMITHLRVLEKAKLVRRRRVGRETRYQLEVEALSRARDYLARASSQLS